MSELLYFDTARLGRMPPSAKRAQRDFVEFAATEGASPCFDTLLRSGLNENAADRFPGLNGWKGIGHFKNCLRSLANGLPDLPVLVASRSALLMKLAGRLLFQRCRNVLISDLGWPGYHDILFRECSRANRMVTVVSLREAITSGRMDADELVSYLADEFGKNRCDGLFLSAVSNLGIHLPAERIVSALQAKNEIWFTVIDGAQDFCHLLANLGDEYCDLYLAGAHKWLGAYHPLGLAFTGSAGHAAISMPFSGG